MNYCNIDLLDSYILGMFLQYELLTIQIILKQKLRIQYFVYSA